MLDLAREAEAIRIHRHEQFRLRSKHAALLMRAAVIIRHYELGDGLALEALSDRIINKETP